MPLGRTNINLPEIKVPTKKLWLYREGDECDDVAGGWVKSGYSRGSATLTKNADNMTLSCTASGNQTATVLTANKIDVTDYSNVCIEFEYTNSTSYGMYIFGVTSSTANTALNASTTVALYAKDNIYSDSGIAKIDVSDVSGEYYIGASNDRWTSGNAKLIVKNVWLEP